jgi:hypothetical protein
VADSGGAAMRGTVGAPLGNETARADGEAIAAVAVADFQNRAGHGFAFRRHQLQLAARGLGDGEQRHRAMLDRHFYRKATSHFAVIDLQRPDFRLALRDGDVAGAVVAHQNHVARMAAWWGMLQLAIMKSNYRTRRKRRRDRPSYFDGPMRSAPMAMSS